MDRLISFWNGLPSAVRTTLHTLLTIAWNGGATALGFAVIDPDHFNIHELKHLGAVFGMGALVAVINWVRQSPWKRATAAVSPLGLSAGVLLVLLLPAPCQAQAVAGDALVSPWTTQRQTANILSDVTVAADLALDTWASWKAPDRRQAFTKQLIRDGSILGVSELTKRLVHRTRPDGSDQLSFYSEHTAFAASAIGGPRIAFVLPLTLSTGYLRIAADKHYLTDTLVGALVGGLVGHFTR